MAKSVGWIQRISICAFIAIVATTGSSLAQRGDEITGNDITKNICSNVKYAGSILELQLAEHLEISQIEVRWTRTVWDKNKCWIIMRTGSKGNYACEIHTIKPHEGSYSVYKIQSRGLFLQCSLY